ncbi:MAG: hypothetical protein ACI9Q3_000591 [Maribacter sp.]|jgi:hypothetical protein
MKDYRKLFLVILFIINSSNLFSQDWSCEDTVHGVFEHIHMNCTQDILITATQEETNGTMIRGVITTTGSIIIKPGYSVVRVLPNGAEPKGILPHTTKIGGNGNDGAKSTNNTITVYPNAIANFLHIRSASRKMVGYKISDFYGNTLKKEPLALTNKITLPVVDLKKGIYLLNIQLENGTQHIKTIIKN